MKSVIINILGAIASILALLLCLYFQFFASEDKSLLLRIQDTQLLTKDKSPDNQLEAEYYFNDSLVDNLWVLRFSLENSGVKSILGEGKRTDLVQPVLPLVIADGFRIIQLDSIDANFPYGLTYIENNLEVGFELMQPGDFLDYKLYLIRDSIALDSIPTFQFKERSMIDVETKVINRRPLPPGRTSVYMFAEPFKQPFRYISLVALIILSVLAVDELRSNFKGKPPWIHVILWLIIYALTCCVALNMVWPFAL